MTTPIAGDIANFYNVVIADAHSKSVSFKVHAKSSALAIQNVFSRDITIDLTEAGFTLTDTITVTAVIA